MALDPAQTRLARSTDLCMAVPVSRWSASCGVTRPESVLVCVVGRPQNLNSRVGMRMT